MKYFLLLIFSITLVTCSVITNENYLDLFSTFDDSNDVKSCTKPGTMCKSCKALVTCIAVDDGFEEVPLQNCNSNETCLIDTCTTDLNPQCSQPNENSFICTATAIFPDPYDCHFYHVCVIVTDSNDEGVYHNLVKCDDNYGYDPTSTYCKVHLSDNACPMKPPVPKCEKVGQSGALSNPSIYYICLYPQDSIDLVPSLRLCPHGQKYVSQKCV